MKFSLSSETEKIDTINNEEKQSEKQNNESGYSRMECVDFTKRMRMIWVWSQGIK